MIIIVKDGFNTSTVYEISSELTELEILSEYEAHLGFKMLEAGLVTRPETPRILSHVQDGGIKLNRRHLKTSREVLVNNKLGPYLKNTYGAKEIENWVELIDV